MFWESDKVEAQWNTRYGRANVYEPPDENCSCRHGGEEAEDHIAGNGCERRGCTCRYWPVD